LNVEIIWNFFATSHGKRVVDGLGGTVKWSVWRAVKSGSQLKNAKQFYQVAKIKKIKNSSFLYPRR
jgi:hypothetical protein